MKSIKARELYHFRNTMYMINCKQKCIPVGCVPSATVAVCRGGPGLGGVCSGGCLVRGGAWSGRVCSGGVPGFFWGGVWSAPGGCLVWRRRGVCSREELGVCSQGVGIPECTDADPPVNIITDRCKTQPLQLCCGRQKDVFFNSEIVFCFQSLRVKIMTVLTSCHHQN